MAPQTGGGAPVVYDPDGLAQQGELPALLRAEQLSTDYLRDVWSQAGIIARERGPDIQRTIEDVRRADAVIRSGFRRRVRVRKCVGLGLAVLGSVFASVGGTEMWRIPRPAFFAGFFVLLVVGLICSFVGIVLAHGTD